MKTKTFNRNRITRSHTSSTAAASTPRHSASKAVTSEGSVAKREPSAISRQLSKIRESWTSAERVERAQMGAERRAELCLLLFGSN